MSTSSPNVPGLSERAMWLRWGGLAVIGIGVVGAQAAEFAAASPTQPQLGLEPLAYLLGLTAVLAVGLFSTTRPLLMAGLTVGLVLLLHVLSFPGGGAGFALFAAVFELGRVRRRTTLIAAAATPIAWALLLALPPHAVPLASPALWGPVAGMLWTGATGYAFGRTGHPEPTGTDVSGPPRQAPAADEFSALLTRREQEVAELVATGIDNATIARRLSISPLTVKSHVAHIMAKTDTATRAQLVARILRARIPV